MSIHFDELETGWNETYGPPRIRCEEMYSFAEQFDPQPMYLDPAVARAKIR